MSGYPQFPESECTRFNDHLFVHRRDADNEFADPVEFRLWFNVGVQYFQLGDPSETLEHSLWRAGQFQKALDRYAEERT